MGRTDHFRRLGWFVCLQVVANPCTFAVNEIAVGVTTNDVLKHMVSEETARMPNTVTSDRMSRTVEHLVLQRNYYPLFPAPEGAPPVCYMDAFGLRSLPVTFL